MGFYKTIGSFERELSDVLTQGYRAGIYYRKDSYIEINERSKHKYTITFININPNINSTISSTYIIKKKQLFNIYHKLKENQGSYITFKRIRPDTIDRKIFLWSACGINLCSYSLG